MLAIGTRDDPSWWATIPNHREADAKLEQGNFEIEGADPLQTLDAIVDLQGTGFLALGRAKRERVQDHDQVIAVGFDRAGAPTWSRVLERFRATEIYGGAGNPALLGAANFVARDALRGSYELVTSQTRRIRSSPRRAPPLSRADGGLMQLI